MQHDEICSKLAQRVIELASGDYASLSQVTDISLLYANSPSTRMPVMYKPGIVILFQGKKTGYLGNSVFHYDATKYLMLTVPLPPSGALLEIANESADAAIVPSNTLD